MLLFFDDDLPQGAHRFLVHTDEFLDLLVHVSKHHALNSYGGSGHGVSTGKTSHGTKNETAEAAPEIAAAAALATTRQFLSETRAMPALMRKKMIKLWKHLRGTPSRKPSLSEVDADSTVLAGMIDLHHPVAKSFTSI